MPKVFGPLMSFDASGTLASKLTFTHRRGKPCVVSRPLPSQPRSPAQRGARAFFAWCTSQWPLISQADRDTWTTYAAGVGLTPAQAFFVYNRRRWLDAWTPETIYPASDNSGGSQFELFLHGKARTWIVLSTDTDFPPLDPEWGFMYFLSTSPIAGSPSELVGIANNTGGTLRVADLNAGHYFANVVSCNRIVQTNGFGFPDLEFDIP